MNKELQAMFQKSTFSISTDYLLFIKEQDKEKVKAALIKLGFSYVSE